MFVIFLFAVASVSLACPQKDIEKFSDNSCDVPKNVKLFNKYFADEVKDCQQLTCVFNGARNVTREEFKAALFYTISVMSSEAGYEKPTEQALDSIKNVVPNCKKLYPELLISIYSNTAGRRLNEEKKLCPSNAQVLASTYSRYTKEVANTTAGENCPRSKILAVISGLYKFLEAQDLYKGDKIAEVPRVYSNEWRCRDKNAGPYKKCPIACYTKPALEKNDTVCQIQDKAVDVFVSAFHNQVKKCKVLSNLFNLQPTVTPAMFSRGTYYLALYYLGKNAAPDARNLADIHSRFIKDVKTLKPCFVEGVHSKFVAKFLLKVEILNASNAEKLAEMFAATMKDKARSIVDERDARSKIVAIQVAWRKFMKSLKIPGDLLTLASFYGNEWRCPA